MLNWSKEIEKLQRAYDRAVEDNDYEAQESLAREISYVLSLIPFIEEVKKC